MKDVEKIKLKYPKGTTIRCIKMNDPIHSIPSGMKGEVEYVDALGYIHMKWENGSNLTLIPTKDTFEKVIEKHKTMENVFS